MTDTDNIVNVYKASDADDDFITDYFKNAAYENKTKDWIVVPLKIKKDLQVLVTDLNNDDDGEIIKWCEENTTGEFDVKYNCMRFEKEEDAVMYKLMWCQ